MSLSVGVLSALAFRDHFRGDTKGINGGGLNTQVGCDGLEVAFLVIAAFAVAPMGWRIRLIGLAIGLPMVYALNQARILVLFYVNRMDKSLFDLLHTTTLPIALIVLVAMYFYVCLSLDARGFRDGERSI